MPIKYSKILLICFLSIASLSSFGINGEAGEESSVFSGRISRINNTAKLIRLKISFENSKFLRKRDRIEFWNETYPEKKCNSYIEARTSEYLLLRVPLYDICISRVHASVGSYLHLYSPDLSSGISVARDLVDVLKKKHLALTARELRFQKEVSGFVEKMDAVNKRYEVLRQKLEIEWHKELTALEEDKVKSYMSYKHTQSRINELKHKLQQYKVHDQNLTLDRWSLDPKLYYKK